MIKEIKEEVLEIQKAHQEEVDKLYELKNNTEKNYQTIQSELLRLNSCYARVVTLMTDLEELLVIKQNEFYEENKGSLQGKEKLTITLFNELRDFCCREELLSKNRADLLSKAISKSIEICRSLLSAQKQELGQSNGGYC